MHSSYNGIVISILAVVYVIQAGSWSAKQVGQIGDKGEVDRDC